MIDLILIEEVFHCTFEVLDSMDGIRMLRTLTVLEAKSMVQKMRSNSKR